MYETEQTEHLQISDRDDYDQLPISDDDKARIEEISEMFEDTSLIKQRSSAHGGGAESSSEASVELHFHFDHSTNHTTNISVQGDSALDRVKALFGRGGSDE